MKTVKKKNTKKKTIVEHKTSPVLEIKSNYLDLPIKDIKMDLVGMFVFAALSFLGIILLNYYNIELSDILSFFRF
jgi:hypothetical protein